MHPNLTSFDFNFLLLLFLPIFFYQLPLPFNSLRVLIIALFFKKAVTLGQLSLIELEECHFLHQNALSVYSAELIHEQRNLIVKSVGS